MTAVAAGQFGSLASINDSGIAVGVSEAADHTFQGVTYDGVSLTTLPIAAASGINSFGQITGTANNGAIIYSGGVVTSLGTLGGSYSSGSAINDQGQVVGQSNLSGDTTSHAFLYSNGTMTDLGTLGGDISLPRGMNNSGEVVGQATTADGNGWAFLYSNGNMLNLGSLGQPASMAWSINNSGTVVGEAAYANGHPQHAFIYAGGTMTDLNTLIPGGSGWELISARAINDSGEIVGWGYDNGNERAFLLIPVPEPKSYGLVSSELLLGLVLARKVSARWRKHKVAENKGLS